MGFLDTVLGRKKPVRPNLDALFAIPAAAITLQVSMDLLPTGSGAVAFRSVEGRAMADVEQEIRDLLDADGGPPVFPFSDPTEQMVALIFLYKRGTFYPFAPARDGSEQRDNVAELKVRDQLAGELPWESDLSRWFAVWGAPGTSN